MSTQTACPSCSHPNAAAALCCGMCGAVLQREEATGDPEPIEPEVRAEQASQAPWSPFQAQQKADARWESQRPVVTHELEPWRELLKPLALGLALSPLFLWTPFLQLTGWFLSAIVHESGHCVVGWFFGCPGYPAVSIAGHAVAIHQGQWTGIACLVWAALGYLVWLFRKDLRIAVPIAAAVLLYPAFAFTGAKELFFLLGGHLGEYAFATIALWRALEHGFTESKAERVLYATVGFYMVLDNLRLCWGLMYDAAAIDRYQGNGSFGLTNDYIRVADDVLGWSLQGVAGLMFLLALVPPILALTIWYLGSRR